MKKMLTFVMSLMLLMMVVGCSNDTKEVTDIEKEQEVEVVEEVKEVKKDEFYFDGEVAEIRDLKIKIIDTKIIPVGEEGNEYGDKPIFAIWYEATNKSDKEIDAGTAWIVIFNAIQDNDDNMIKRLEVAMLPDQQYLDTQMAIIKKDGIVENAIAYELDDEVTPVTLIATRGVGGDEIGRHDYKVD